MVSAVVALAMIVAACGGGGDEDAQTQTTGAPDRFTIWAPNTLKKPLDTTVQKFNKHEPDIEVEVVYGAGNELNDRLLVGETPDLYLATANDVQKLAREGTLPDEKVDFGKDVVLIVVAPDNPKRVADVSVFGLDPSTTSGLCVQTVACGRAGRAVLANARIPAAPDFNEPDAATLVQRIANLAIDAGLVYRTQAVKARQKGAVGYVTIPTAQGVEVGYQFAIVRHGAAADRFIHYIQTSNSVPKILGQAGLAPLPGDPQ